jgi:hypothetical protein
MKATGVLPDRPAPPFLGAVVELVPKPELHANFRRTCASLNVPLPVIVAQFASDLAEIAAGLLSGIAAFTQEKTMMRRESARFS